MCKLCGVASCTGEKGHGCHYLPNWKVRGSTRVYGELKDIVLGYGRRRLYVNVKDCVEVK